MALAGIILAGFLHLYNGYLSGLPFGMHSTADDASYLAPAENWWHTGTWKDNSVGVSSYIQRPPMMGIIHLVEYVPFGKYALAVHFLFCLMLYGWSLYRLPRLLGQFIPEKQAFTATWIYVLSPCFSGFLSYQITESVSPALVLLLLSFLLQEKKTNSTLITILLLTTALWLLRPVLILLVLFPMLIHLKKNWLSFRKAQIGLTAVFCLLAVFSWEYRKAGYSGKWGELHPIYHANNASLYRPPHEAMSDLFRIWETRPEVFHAITHSCWGEDSTKRSVTFLESYIQERKVPMSASELRELLAAYAAVNRPVIRSVESGNTPIQTAEEHRFIHRIYQLENRLRKSNKRQYHLTTPFISMKEMLTKSQLNLELFQVRFRGNLPIELLRYWCVVLINLLIAGTILLLFRRKTELRWVAFGVILYGFYLFYVQRLNEDRYLIPALGILFVTGTCYWLQLINRFRHKRVN